MIGKTILHYKILEKLGEGGMGVVYKAHDTKLDRFVALKFLPKGIEADEAEQARFLQEAKAASALSHPNVCIIHDIQEYEGQQFIVMEYVDGVTLREKLKERAISESPLPLKDVLSYSIQIGEALQEAHSKGIIHRDIKSDNIMINEKGQVKVMDFGLAKLKGSLKLTKTSSTVGTLAYMSPEQLKGEKTDARMDIFSFGVVLYEMLTGHLPFRGEYESALMYSILNTEPEPVTKYRQELSSGFLFLLDKALEKEPDERYQSISDILVDLRRLKRDTSKVSRKPALEMPPIVQAEEPAPAVPVAPYKKFVWAIGKSPLIYASAAALFVLVLVVVSTVLYFRKEKPVPSSERKMLVVLPFENLGSSEDEYFADGITEEITVRLAGIKGLGVIARTSAIQYKNIKKNIQQVGKELNVDYILEGTVRWQRLSEGQSRVRVTPQLIKVSDATHLWASIYDKDMADIFQVQSDIAKQVAEELGIALLEPERRALKDKPTDNLEAYDYYLRGIEYINRGVTEKNLRIALQMYQKSVDLDPDFASGLCEFIKYSNPSILVPLGPNRTTPGKSKGSS